MKVGQNTTPVARMFTSSDAPPGVWTRNEHWFAPVTPLCADFQIGSEVPRGFNAAMDELALPTPRFEFVVIDGYGYQAMLQSTPHLGPDHLSAFEERVRARHEKALIRRWWEQARPRAEAELERVRALDLQGFTDDQLLSHIRDLSEYTMELCGIHFANILATGIIVGRFGSFCNERLDLADAEIFRLFAGASSASRLAIVELERLAGVVLQSPALRSATTGSDAWSSPLVQQLLQPYLQAFGHHAVDFEYATPTLAEQPERAVRLLQDTLTRMEHARTDARAGQADQVPDTLRGAWRNRLADEAERAEFDRLLDEAVDAYSVRDDDCAFVMLAWGLMRGALLEAGRRFAGRGALRDREDVWYLRRPELEQGLLGMIGHSSDLFDKIDARRADRQRQQMAGLPPSTAGVPTVSTPPSALAGLSPEARRALAALAWTRRHGGAPESTGLALAEQSLRGVGASPGTYQGIARVIRGEAEFDRLQAGEILVCPFTSPTWTILFGTAGAIVTNEGGLLSHPAITAREFGIPAVVGTRVASDVIPDGSLVTVDGTNGLVIIGERVSASAIGPSPPARARHRQTNHAPNGAQSPVLPAKGVAVVWLDEEACQDPMLTGGKAANLSRLADRYRVPTGFCVTSVAFDAHAAANGVFPVHLREHIQTMYAQLTARIGRADAAVAVRSSAIDEDGQDAAFAGQYETVLNVKGTNAVEDAILHCWRSATAARALAYRAARGLDRDSDRVAVLIQQMIPAEASGVLFSANPVTGRTDEVVLTASFGLGESVVRGSVTPDTFVVRRSGPTGLEIVRREIAIKNVMTVLTDTGTAEVPVPEALREQPSVLDDQVREAARVACALEADMGWPVDVECAFHNRVLYVLQCRPITALRDS